MNISKDSTLVVIGGISFLIVVIRQEDLFDLLLDYKLFGAERHGKFLRDEIACHLEHLLFAEGKFLPVSEVVELFQNRRDLIDGTALDPFHVFLVPSVPGRVVVNDVLVLEDIVDLAHLTGIDDASQAGILRAVDRYHDGHVRVEDADYVE